MLSLRFPLPPPEPKLFSLPKSTPLSPISIKRLPSRLTPSRLSLFDSTVSAYVEEELRSKASDARVPVEADEEREGVLPSGLQREFMPNHVAVIMDGNERWARKRGSPSSVSHEAGVRSLKQLIQLCYEWEIRVLTVLAFSYDNWNRPKIEIEFLMNLFERGIESELENFVSYFVEDHEFVGVGVGARFGTTMESKEKHANQTKLTLSDPPDCCSTPKNKLTGEVILVHRGNCKFTTKAIVAQVAGASAILIVNYKKELYKMVCDPNETDLDIHILAVVLPQDAGSILESSLENNSSVAVQLYSLQRPLVDIA